MKAVGKIPQHGRENHPKNRDCLLQETPQSVNFASENKRIVHMLNH